MSNPAKVDLEPAFVLHSRAYRETSELLEVFTANHGRVGLVARGARRPKSPLRGALNPFQPLRVSWSGRGELQTLRGAEATNAPNELAADRIMAGFYVNELLMKLLHRNDAHPELFMYYGSVVARLGTRENIEVLLRGFELELLREIGYALNLEKDSVSHEPLREKQQYEFRVEQGAVVAEYAREDDYCFSGAELLAIGRREFDDPAVLKRAKYLLRAALNYHLGGRGLETRRVAAAMKR
jgi:DNA repair protein RecO (recombination protein O)